MAEWQPDVVQQGDHVEKLAYLHGVAANDVWGNAKNAELAKKRQTMHQLLPGDVLYLPEAPQGSQPIAKGTLNTYKAVIPLKDFSLSIHGSDRKPIAGAPYFIEGLGGGGPASGTTGPDGAVKFRAPVTQREVTIVLPQNHQQIQMRIGDLDPHDERSGAVQRLKNLEYLSPNADGGRDISREVMLFQRDRGLPMTGVFDEVTTRELDDAACPKKGS